MRSLFIIYLVFSLVGCSEEISSPRSSTVVNKLGAYESTRIVKNEIDVTEDGVTHVATAVPTNPISADGWLLTFEDNFDDAATAIAKGADAKCFSMAPNCMINWWHAEECPEFSTELANLNKCNWAAYNYYNYMDFDLPEGQGINSFHPTMIEVKDGMLYLNATKSFYQTIDCKNKFKDPRIGNLDNYTFQCPFISGAVES